MKAIKYNHSWTHEHYSIQACCTYDLLFIIRDLCTSCHPLPNAPRFLSLSSCHGLFHLRYLMPQYFQLILQRTSRFQSLTCSSNLGLKLRDSGKRQAIRSIRRKAENKYVQVQRIDFVCKFRTSSFWHLEPSAVSWFWTDSSSFKRGKKNQRLSKRIKNSLLQNII